jgi:Leucine-rich repeat (LRR) protein
MKHLVQLRRLCLPDNELKELPSAIQFLTNLVSLHVEMNRITSIPSWISALSNLSVLSIHNNRLTTLPSSLNSLSLVKHLDLSFNPIQDLPCLTTITNFTLGCRSDMKLELIPSSLYTWTQLTFLILLNVSYIYKEISRLTNLEYLILDTKSSFVHFPIEFRLLTRLRNAETCVLNSPLIKFASKKRNERMEFYNVQYDLYHSHEDNIQNETQKQEQEQEQKR